MNNTATNDRISQAEHAFKTGDLQKALRFAVQELKENPYSKEAYILAGQVLQTAGDWPSAASYYLNALKIDPYYALPQVLFIEHYLNTHFEGYTEALESVLQRIPNHIFALENLMRYYYSYHEWQKIHATLHQALLQESIPKFYRFKMCILALLAQFVNGRVEAQDHARLFSFDVSRFTPEEITFLRPMSIYHKFILKLLAYQDQYPAFYENPPETKLYVIGESHALECAQLNVTLGGMQMHCSIQHIIGLKAHHFSKRDINSHMTMHYFEHSFARIPKSSKVLVMVGEIDCRVDEGILPYALKNQEPINDVVEHTVQSYVSELSRLNAAPDHHLILCTVPPLSTMLINEGKEHYGEEKLRQIPKVKEVIGLFNQYLKKYAGKYGFQVLDTYTHNLAEDGFAKPDVHIDSHHLKPEIIIKAAEQTMH